MIPSLETERLVLRAMTIEDWPDYAALMQSERAQYMGGPMSKEDAWGIFCSDIAQWHLFGHGALMIDERASGRCVGQVGINHGPLFPEHELGWFVYERGEGRGYAFEAAVIFRDWAREKLKLPSLVSYMDADNVRSRKLAERLGALEDKDAPRPSPGNLVYRHFE